MRRIGGSATREGAKHFMGKSRCRLTVRIPMQLIATSLLHHDITFVINSNSGKKFEYGFKEKVSRCVRDDHRGSLELQQGIDRQSREQVSLNLSASTMASEMEMA